MKKLFSKLFGKKEELSESGADLVVDTLERTEELFEFLLARNN